VRKALVLAVGCALWLSGCSEIRHQGPSEWNDAAALSGNLPYNPLQWSVITSAVSRRDATVYAVFGNGEASSFARSGADGSYPIGAKVSMVAWTQRPSPRWFGGMIPGAVRSVEYASVVTGADHRPEYVYEKFEGNPLQSVMSQRESIPTGRLAYLLAQRGAFMP
jgi:hypothetical protein